MKAVVSVIGKDKIGILAMIANECANASINILDVSQTIVDGMFTMTMSVDFHLCLSLWIPSQHIWKKWERKRA